jgi:hypothetical protein
MISAADGPQEYQLFKHEFHALNPKEKGGYAFTLQAYQGKAVNNIKQSVVAKDLLYILELSKKANELMDADMYEFAMDKKFMLRISRHNVEPEPQESESTDSTKENS